MACWSYRQAPKTGIGERVMQIFKADAVKICIFSCRHIHIMSEEERTENCRIIIKKQNSATIIR